MGYCLNVVDNKANIVNYLKLGTQYLQNGGPAGI